MMLGFGVTLLSILKNSFNRLWIVFKYSIVFVVKEEMSPPKKDVAPKESESQVQSRRRTPEQSSPPPPLQEQSSPQPSIPSPSLTPASPEADITLAHVPTAKASAPQDGQHEAYIPRQQSEVGLYILFML